MGLEEIPLDRQLEAPTLAAHQSKAITPYAMAIDGVVASFTSDPERGLSAEQVVALRALHGWNELTEAPPTPLWKKLLGQFKDLVIWILIVAAVISGAIGEWPDTVAILAIVLLNGLLGFFQEERAEQSLAALQKLSAPLAKVIREGVLASLPARDLVAGDLIELEAGDNIPADARLIRAFRPARSRGGTHRRVGSGREGCELRISRCHTTGRPPQHGLHGYGPGGRKGECDRRRHRDAH